MIAHMPSTTGRGAMNPTATADLSQATWRKSSRSSGGGSNCVEVACLPGHIAIRDSKNPEAAALILTPVTFHDLTDAVVAGPSGPSTTQSDRAEASAGQRVTENDSGCLRM